MREARGNAENKLLREREIALQEAANAESKWLREREIKLQEVANELRMEELKRQKEVDAVRHKNDNSLAARTRKFADAIKHVFVKMSEDAAEAPLFFEGIENLFKMYEIPADLQSKLLLPLLNSKARIVTARLTVAELPTRMMLHCSTHFFSFTTRASSERKKTYRACIFSGLKRAGNRQKKSLHCLKPDVLKCFFLLFPGKKEKNNIVVFFVLLLEMR